MGKIVCVTNQKGGVGKTTTAIQLGRGLMILNGCKVLFVDMDSQCNMTYVLGADDEKYNIMSVLSGECSAAEAVQHVDGIDIIPSSQDISAMQKVASGNRTEFVLREALAPLKNRYDYIVIDSPPALGLVTVNILTASDVVVIPAVADILSLQGIGQLYNTINAVKTYCNPDLKIDGILLTRHNDRLIHSREVREMIQDTADQIGTRVYNSKIRESVVIREATTSRQSVFDYAPKSSQADDYWGFVAEFLSNGN